MASRGPGFGMGFLLGLVIGAALALILAPERKSQTVEQARAAWETGRQVVGESVQQGRDAAARRRAELETRLRRGRSSEEDDDPS